MKKVFLSLVAALLAFGSMCYTAKVVLADVLPNAGGASAPSGSKAPSKHHHKSDHKSDKNMK